MHKLRIIIRPSYRKIWQEGAKAKFQKNGGGQAIWSSRGSQEIFVFRLSDIASGAFLGTEVSVLGLGLLSTSGMKVLQ